MATFELSKNVAIALTYAMLAMRVSSNNIFTGSKLMPLPSAHAHGTNGHRYDTFLVCILLIDDHA